MALSGTDQAYLYARSGIARSGATRSNYVAVRTSIDWIVRDGSGNIVSTTDISDRMLHGSLHVTQALNDEPDTCSFELRPDLAPAPAVGQEIRIAWAPGGTPLFHGYVLVTQHDWRASNRQPPWVSVQCQDPMWRFDARIVTYRFPAQSVTASIQFLVQWFCNEDPAGAHPLNFSTAFVETGMPSIEAFDVVNQRPSTVMRSLTAAVGGGFYLEGLTLHAWATSVSEPHQSNPVPLTVDLPTLKAFRLTTDATQVRRRVLVEGRRTATMISVPTVTAVDAQVLGLPITDASLFDAALGDAHVHLTRIGTQWIEASTPVAVTAGGANPPQTKVFQDYLPGDPLRLTKMLTLPPVNGWIRAGNQYSLYVGYTGDPLSDEGWVPGLPLPGVPYGTFTVPLAAGDTVEWVDAVMRVEPRGLGWGDPAGAGDPLVRAEPVETPVVVLAVAETTRDQWPPLEGFVQDGRYSAVGAQARAEADLAAFQEPLLSAEWITEDLNASPGRSQVITLSSENINPPINTTVTIQRVDLTFPLPTLPPRRACSGARVKPSTFLDLVLTSTS
jgi:hypothetical protein